MSRDFLISFSSKTNLEIAHRKLSELSDQVGERLFGLLDIREKEMSIFATLTYSHSIDNKFFSIGDKKNYLKNHLNFVAMKNGEHSSKGFCLTNAGIKPKSSEMSIWDLSNFISKKINS